MRRRHDLLESEQGEIRIAQRLVLEHVDRGVAGPARAQRSHERARLRPAARPWLADDESVRTLTELAAAVGLPERAPAAPTSARKIRRALRDLREAVERFNGRWAEFLRWLDLSAVNQSRDGYNRYYLLEKECALGALAVARDGFRPLPPLTTEALLELLPPLPVPR